MTPTGSVTIVHTFCSLPLCANGDFPEGGLIQATNGNLYGTTWSGGVNGYGTVYEITPSGTLTVLHSFCSLTYCVDGANPLGTLVQASNGDLYGTTQTGGTGGFGLGGSGTIFKIATSGVFSTLYSFCSQSNCTDGSTPQAGLVQVANGDLYGTTFSGGNTNPQCEVGEPPLCGIVFKITPSGAFTIVYSFCSQPNCTDGANPFFGSLIQATNGKLYGTTEFGGVNNNLCHFGNCGTIFEITPSGSLTTVHSFCSESGCLDGANPRTGVIQSAAGDLYGATLLGGNSNNGMVFEIAAGGTFTNLYSFCSQPNCSDGVLPIGPIQATDGVLYGQTLGSGANGSGTIFTLSTGQPPFVETRPTMGAVNELVTIVGYGLQGATSVTFNGTPAIILSDEPTAIYAKVPAGAQQRQGPCCYTDPHSDE